MYKTLYEQMNVQTIQWCVQDIICAEAVVHRCSIGHRFLKKLGKLTGKVIPSKNCRPGLQLCKKKDTNETVFLSVFQSLSVGALQTHHEYSTRNTRNVFLGWFVISSVWVAYLCSSKVVCPFISVAILPLSSIEFIAIIVIYVKVRSGWPDEP